MSISEVIFTLNKMKMMGAVFVDIYTRQNGSRFYFAEVFDNKILLMIYFDKTGEIPPDYGRKLGKYYITNIIDYLIKINKSSD